MSMEKFIDSFGDLPTWKKMLLFIPLILSVVLVALLASKSDATGDKVWRDRAAKDSKKKADNELKSFKKEFKRSEKELEKLEQEKKRIKREIRNESSNYSDTINRIDNADLDELLRIADEIRDQVKRDSNK